MDTKSNGSRIIRLQGVKAKTGLARATIYMKIKANAFPQQISLGVRCVGWLESEIDDWIHARANERRAL